MLRYTKKIANNIGSKVQFLKKAGKQNFICCCFFFPGFHKISRDSTKHKKYPALPQAQYTTLCN